jgi:hypothetical protein
VSSGPQSAPRRAGERTFIAALLTGATLLRVVGLDAPLWYDEIVTLTEYARLGVAEITTTYAHTNNHVLYSLLAHGSLALFGESAWSLRLPAMLFGVASVGALYAVGREVTRRREAAFAAVLMAIAYHHVWFSQNARGYTGILFFGLAATWVFLRAARGGSVRAWLLYAALFALAMYTHLSAVFVFASHALVWPLMWWQRGAGPDVAPHGDPPTLWRAADLRPLLGFAAGSALILIAYAPLLLAVTAAFGTQSAASDAAAVGEWKSPLWTAIETVRSLGMGAAGLAAALLGAVVAGSGLLSYARRDPFLALLMLLPAAVGLAMLLALSFNIWPRYFLVEIGFACLVLVRGCAVLGERLVGSRTAHPQAARRAGWVLCTLLVVAAALALPRNYRLPKQDYPGARDFVESERAPGDVVVTLGLASLCYARHYAPEWTVVESLAELEAARPARAATWLVYSFPRLAVVTHAEIFAALGDFETVRIFPGTLGDGEIRVLRSPAGRHETGPVRDSPQ